MSTPALVFSTDPQNFQTDVIDRSREVPVLVLFWAEQVPESVSARQILDTQVNARQGKLLLALVDVSQDQSLAQHLRVQSLPSIRVIREGQIAEQLDGPQPESEIAALCDRLTLSGADVLKAQLADILAKGDFATALGLVQQAIEAEPANTAFRVELADILVLQGNLEDARTVLASMDPDTQEIQRPRNRLEFAEQAKDEESIEALEVKCGLDAGDLRSRQSLAVQYIAANRMEDALEAALHILCTDRKFEDDIGRLTMLRIFEILPKGSELTSSFRRRMFNFMH